MITKKFDNFLYEKFVDTLGNVDKTVLDYWNGLYDKWAAGKLNEQEKKDYEKSTTVKILYEFDSDDLNLKNTFRKFYRSLELWKVSDVILGIWREEMGTSFKEASKAEISYFNRKLRTMPSRTKIIGKESFDIDMKQFIIDDESLEVLREADAMSPEQIQKEIENELLKTHKFLNSVEIPWQEVCDDLQIKPDNIDTKNVKGNNSLSSILHNWWNKFKNTITDQAERFIDWLFPEKTSIEEEKQKMQRLMKLTIEIRKGHMDRLIDFLLETGVITNNFENYLKKHRKNIKASGILQFGNLELKLDYQNLYSKEHPHPIIYINSSKLDEKIADSFFTIKDDLRKKFPELFFKDKVVKKNDKVFLNISQADLNSSVIYYCGYDWGIFKKSFFYIINLGDRATRNKKKLSQIKQDDILAELNCDEFIKAMKNKTPPLINSVGKIDLPRHIKASYPDVDKISISVPVQLYAEKVEQLKYDKKNPGFLSLTIGLPTEMMINDTTKKTFNLKSLISKAEAGPFTPENSYSEPISGYTKVMVWDDVLRREYEYGDRETDQKKFPITKTHKFFGFFSADRWDHDASIFPVQMVASEEFDLSGQKKAYYDKKYETYFFKHKFIKRYK